MKHPVFFFLLGLIGWFAGCTHTDVPRPHSMRMAESCMEHRPDSALALLHGLADSLEGWPEETRMYHRLLTLQAEDRQYVIHSDDSLIRELVRYYETAGDECRLVQAYYLLGKVYISMSDAPQALKAFRQALEVPSIGPDMQERVYSEMAPLFSAQGLADDAIQANRCLLDLYRAKGNRQGMATARRTIARMFALKAESDSASLYYQEAWRSALAAGDSAVYYAMLAEWAGLQYDEEKNPAMMRILQEAARREDIPDKSNIHFILSQMYKDIGMPDSMAYYCHLVIGSGNIEKVYHSYRELYEWEKRKRNPVKALEYMEKAMSTRNLLQTVSQREALAQINALFNYQHISDENALLKLSRAKQQNVILVLVLLTVSVVFACFATIVYQRKRSRRALERERKLKQLAEERYAKSQKAVGDNERSIAELNSKLLKAQAENDRLACGTLMVEMKKLQLQNEEILLSQHEQRERIKLFQQADLYKLILQASLNDAVILGDADWEAVWQSIDYMYPSFNAHLDDVFPGIGIQIRQLCWLTKLGIKPAGIARILKRSRQAVSNTRTKLNKVIAESPLPDTNFDDFIANL